jgi:hypothetical protein
LRKQQALKRVQQQIDEQRKKREAIKQYRDRVEAKRIQKQT